MNAKKCDRCGEFYVEVMANPIETAMHNLVEAFRKIKNGEDFSLYKKLKDTADLCSDCDKRLRVWCMGGDNDK